MSLSKRRYPVHLSDNHKAVSRGNSTSFLPAHRNPRWRGGRSVNSKGYTVITVTGPDYMKYEHRVVIERLLATPERSVTYVWGWGNGVPVGMTVHHLDSRRRHNCLGNLMLLDHQLHNAVSRARRKWILENYEEWTEWEKREGDERWE